MRKLLQLYNKKKQGKNEFLELLCHYLIHTDLFGKVEMPESCFLTKPRP